MHKTIVVTGASRGIGYETALQLAMGGHTVLAVARSAAALEKLAQTKTSGQILPLVADISSEEGIQAVKNAAAAQNAIHGLINNAGATLLKAFSETSLEEFGQMMDANFFSAVRSIQAIKPLMPAGSHIVNIASMSGFQGSKKFAGLSAYGAAKAALAALSETLSQEFMEAGISVNALCIGAVQTEMLAVAFPGYKAPVSAAQMGTYLADFVLTAHQFYNGKILPVALSDPD